MHAKKNAVKPWLKQQWCLPKEHNAEFVWRMEDVLEVYQRPYDPQCPVICMDEASKQLVAEVRKPLPPGPGKPLRYDSEYERLGTRVTSSCSASRCAGGGMCVSRSGELGLTGPSLCAMCWTTSTRTWSMLCW